MRQGVYRKVNKCHQGNDGVCVDGVYNCDEKGREGESDQGSDR